jgi:hypothetical protein
MDQFSIFDIIPEVEKKVFLDIYGIAFYDANRKRLRLQTLEWPDVPRNLKIGCRLKHLSNFPEGTIYKLDAKLVRNKKGYNYLSAISKNSILPAIDFYKHNQSLLKETKKASN